MPWPIPRLSRWRPTTRSRICRGWSTRSSPPRHGVDVLVIDDNSPDGTGRWCDERAAADSRLHCLHRAGKLGLGTATIAGHAVRHRARLHSTCSTWTPTSAISRAICRRSWPAWSRRRHAGGRRDDRLAIHSRRRRSKAGRCRRHLMSRGVNAYARLMLGLKTKDCSGAFRCYRTAVLAKIDFDAIRSRGYSFQEEILWHLKRRRRTDSAKRRSRLPIACAALSKIDSARALQRPGDPDPAGRAQLVRPLGPLGAWYNRMSGLA